MFYNPIWMGEMQGIYVLLSISSSWTAKRYVGFEHFSTFVARNFAIESSIACIFYIIRCVSWASSLSYSCCFCSDFLFFLYSLIQLTGPNWRWVEMEALLHWNNSEQQKTKEFILTENFKIHFTVYRVRCLPIGIWFMFHGK